MIKMEGDIMKNKASSYRTKSEKKDINSYGYNVANFNVLDIPVRRDPKTGRLISVAKQSSKKRSSK